MLPRGLSRAAMALSGSQAAGQAVPRPRNLPNVSAAPRTTSLASDSGARAKRLCPVQESLMEEMCILVDAQDREVGSASKRQCHTVDPATGKVPLHRAFSLLVFSQEGKLLMQQRSDSKITFPGLWTNTCCSHPSAESEAERRDITLAAQRRVGQELGIRMEQCATDQMVRLSRILYSASNGDDDDGRWGEHELDHVLVYREKADNPLRLDPDPNEVKDVRFVGIDEFDDFIASIGGKSKPKVTPWFSLMMSHESMLFHWWRNLDRIETLSSSGGPILEF